jgi:hypothetical protein
MDKTSPQNKQEKNKTKLLMTIRRELSRKRQGKIIPKLALL